MRDREWKRECESERIRKKSGDMKKREIGRERMKRQGKWASARSYRMSPICSSKPTTKQRRGVFPQDEGNTSRKDTLAQEVEGLASLASSA